MRIEQLLRDREQPTPTRTVRRVGGNPTARPIGELYARLVDAAVTHDFKALRAIAAHIAQDQGRADHVDPRMASSIIE